MKHKIYIGIEIILYISFLWMDLFEQENSNGSSFIKFLGIILCLFYLFLIKKQDCNKGDLILMRAALTFTLFADFFILILEIYIPGLVCFIVVQMLYLIRVRYTRPTRWYLNLLLFFLVVVICRICKLPMDALFLLTSFYFISIVRNVLETVINVTCKPLRLSKSQSILFMMGMILFLLCDINVGIYNMASYIELSGDSYTNLFTFAGVAMWFFYLPSQVCLTLSTIGKKS